MICSATIRIDNQTLNKLKHLSFSNPNRELAGSLILIQKSPKTYSIKIDEKSFKKGKIDDVDGIESKYNFHTHPEDAYEKYKRKFGCPSGQDFMGYFMSVFQYGTVFHLVVAKEGIYVISLNKEAIPRLDELKHKTNDIPKRYKFEYDMNPTDYMNYVEGIRPRIFDVTFIKWGKGDRQFKINFPLVDGICKLKN